MPTAAAVYARISSDPDRDQLGVKRQIADCQGFAERRGWPVHEVYVDDDRSAYSGKLRPAYRRMLADIADGAVDAVVVWPLDRLHRQPKELEDIEGRTWLIRPKDILSFSLLDSKDKTSISTIGFAPPICTT